MRLLLVRHGESVWESEGRIQGQRQVPLSPKGLEQARAVARRIAEEHKPVALYSSDLRRALETAEEIGRLTRLKVEADARLRELHFGAFEGLTIEEAKSRYPDEFARWRRNPLKNRPPKAETLESLLERVKSFLEEARKHHPEEEIVAVSHLGPIRATIILALSLPLEAWRRMKVDCASLTVIEFSTDGSARLEVFNDTCHLRDVATRDP